MRIIGSGRTYSIGYENDLEHVLMNRPVERLLNEDWPWVIWYPLKRKGAFNLLDASAQRDILSEHGRIWRCFR